MAEKSKLRKRDGVDRNPEIGMEANNMAQATKRHRHWKTSWNRHREIRFVLSCTPDEAKLVKKLAQGQSTQSYLMGLVLEAAQREG